MPGLVKDITRIGVHYSAKQSIEEYPNPSTNTLLNLYKRIVMDNSKHVAVRTTEVL